MARALATRQPFSTRRRAGVIAGCGIAAALTLMPVPVFAQLAATSTDLLAPSLQGNPPAAPRFVAPGDTTAPAANAPPPIGVFTAPSRIGATPVYGSPTGLGEGDTGFDAANTPKSKKKRRRNASGAGAGPNATFESVPNFNPPSPPPPPPLQKAPPAEIYPRNAAIRPGAVLPPPPDELPISNPPAEVHPLSAANRPGAVLAVPPPEYFDYSASAPPPTLPPPNTFPLGALPQRPLPLAAGDPYAALGIRAGSFLLLPSVDLSAAYSTNPGHNSPTGPAAPYFIVAPELQVQSNWERHSLTADISGSYTEYASGNLVPSLNVPYLNSKIDGLIDVTRDSQILLENRVIVSSDNPGSPNLQTQLAQLPPNQDVGFTLGWLQQFNRLSVSVKGTFDRATYDESVLTNGETANNADRNFDQYGGILRVGYEIDPGMKPFIEVQEDARLHDEQFDRNDLQRDSRGTSVSVGSAVSLFGSVSGEMAVGWLQRTYQDPTLPGISGPIANGTLLWQIDGLTTAKLTATSQVYETVVDPASGEFSHDVNLQVDHAFRTWLIGTVKLGYGTDDYAGSGLTDNRYFASLGLTYKFTRELQIRGELREDWQTASQPGFSYTATSVLLGLRLQR